MSITNYKFKIPLESDYELKMFTEKALGVKIPDKIVNPTHNTPFQAFSHAYFAKSPVNVWWAARGFGGKSLLLALLGLTEAITLKADVNILGGSGEQSQNVHKYNLDFWSYPGAAAIKEKIQLTAPTQRETKLVYGNTIKALLASQTSVRGPHPQRLRCVAADSLIATPNGEYTINEIVSGQTIYSYDEQYGIIECEAIKSWCSGVKQTIDIELENGKVLSVTPEHKILTSEGWKCAEQIKIGESCISMQSLWKRFVRPTQKQNGTVFGLPEKEEGQGSTQMQGLRSKAIRGEAYKALHEMLQGAYSQAGKQMRILWKENYTESNEMPSMSVRFESKEGKPLFRLRYSTKASYNKKMQEMSLEVHVVREDGCENGGCEGFGTEGKEIKTRKELCGTSKNVRCGCERSSSLREMVGRFCYPVGNDSDRSERGILAQTSEKHGEGQKEDRISGISWIHSDCSVVGEATPVALPTCEVSLVSSIRKAREISVWDLEVKDSHNFIADGVVVHNCDEIDAMDIEILDAALGQPMSKNGIKPHTVLSSTYQNPSGTMTEILKRAKHKNWDVFKWGFEETVEPHGWLPLSDIETKKQTVTEYMWCFRGDQLVTMHDGTQKKIKDVSEDDFVMCDGGNLGTVTRKWTRQSFESLLDIKIKGVRKPISVTGNHKIKTSNGWKKAGELVCGDLLLSPKEKLADGGSYCDGWMVGIYLAEGHSRKDRGNRIQLSLHKDEGVQVLDIATRWAKNNPYEHKTTGFHAGLPTVKYRDNISTVTITHKLYKELLLKWVDVNAHAIDKRMNQLPKERNFAQGVLDGWLYGDGHFAVDKNWVGTTFSDDLAWQMFRLATNLGYATSIGRYKSCEGTFSDNDYYHVYINDFRVGWRKPEVVKEVLKRYKDGVPKRKISRDLGVSRSSIKHWINNEPPKQYGNQVKNLDGYIGREVQSVSTINHNGLLYDITVETEHNYLINGVVVSNSTEYCLSIPFAESRAIHPDAIKDLFDSSLGKFEGRIGERVEIDPLTPEERTAWNIEKAEKEVNDWLPDYVKFINGADWAKEIDCTVIFTLRYDCTPMRLVAFERTQRQPWPVMVKKFDDRNRKYRGRSHHDNTGLGDVIDDYLTTSSKGINMVGKARKDLLSNAINQIERNMVIMPYIRCIEEGLSEASVNDVYGTGHLPDILSSLALTLRGSSMPSALELIRFVE